MEEATPEPSSMLQHIKAEMNVENNSLVTVSVKEERMDGEAAIPETIIPDVGLPPEAVMSEGQTATISLPEGEGEPLMITGEDGVVYRVSS